MRDIMKQVSKNIVTVRGKLLDAQFASGKTKTGKPYERANITLRVKSNFSGVEEINEIPISFFASQYTNSGAVNPAFESLQRLKSAKTVQNFGMDEADTIAITKGELQENNFVSKTTGQVINTWQLRSSFFSSGKGTDTATFIVEGFIQDMRDEMDKEGEPTGRMIIRAGVVGWNGRLDVLDFIVERPDYVDYLSRAWNINDTVLIKGHIRYTSMEVATSNVSSWGEDIEEMQTRTVRELIVTSGSEEAYEEEFAYDIADIKKAYNERKARLEELRMNSKPVKATPAPAQKATAYDWEE